MTDSIRLRRLRSDEEKLQALAAASGGAISIDSTRGNPPDEYLVTYRCRGVASVRHGSPVYRDQHTVAITLPPAYPSPAGRPGVQVKTPIWHPHVFAVGQTVCLGAWQISEHLDQLVLRIGSILQFEPAYFDFNSPANPEARDWVERNIRLFPTDRVSFKAPGASGPSQWQWREL